MTPAITTATLAGVVACAMATTRGLISRAIGEQQRRRTLEAMGHGRLSSRDGVATLIKWLRRVGAHPGGFVRRGGGVVVVSALVSLALGDLVALLVAVVGIGACEMFAWRQRIRNRKVFDQALPRLADGIARSLRSGSSLNIAVWDGGESVGDPIATDVARIRRRVDGGETLLTALLGWSQRHPSGDLGQLVAVCAIGVQVGGRMAQAFEGCAASMRLRREVEAEMAAMASQAQASAYMLSVLPFVVTAFMSLLDARVAQFLVGSLGGLACLAAAVVLDAVGLLWMRSIVKGVW